MSPHVVVVIVVGVGVVGVVGGVAVAAGIIGGNVDDSDEVVSSWALSCAVGPHQDCCTGKGRALFVTEDVKAGTLLAVCNPLAISYAEESAAVLQLDIFTSRMV